MAYVPNAADTSQPTGDKPVSSAAPEFRALKAEALSTLIALGGFQAELDAILAGIAGGNNSAALAANLASSAGSSFIGFTQLGTGAIFRLLQTELRANVTIAQFGAKSDGVTDDAAAIMAAHVYLKSIGGGTIKIPEGITVASDISTSELLSIQGAGAGLSFIKLTGANHRWNHNMDQVGAMAFLQGITFLTNGVSAGVGFHAQYTQLGVPFTDRNDRRVFTNNVEFRGATDANGWVTPLWLDNINGSQHNDLWITGINAGTNDGSELTNTVSPQGVLISGSDYPTDHRFISPTFYSIDTCIVASGYVEGITSIDPVAVNVGMYASWDLSQSPSAGRPGFKLINPHVNSYRGVTDLRGIQQVQILSGELYHNPGANTLFSKANFAFTVNTATDVFTSTAFSFYDNQGVLFSGGTLPAPLAINTVYFIRDANIVTGTFKLCTTAATNTTPASAAIDITAAASGGCLMYRRAGWVGHYLENCVDGQITTDQYFRFLDPAAVATSTGVRIYGPLTKGINLSNNAYGTSDIRFAPTGRMDIGIDLASNPPGQVRYDNGNIFSGQYRIADVYSPGNNYQVAGCRGFQVKLTAAQSIPNATATKILWDTPSYDPMGLWVFGPATYTDFTIPANVGISRLLIGVVCSFAAAAAGTIRRIDVTINGTVGTGLVDGRVPLAGGIEVTTAGFQRSYEIKGGDVISVRVRQDSGGALNMIANSTVLTLEVLT